MMVPNSQIVQKLYRRIIYSFTDFLILAKLKDGLSLSCDDMIRFIHRKFGVKVSPGTVYAHLYSLEQDRFLTGYFDTKKHAHAQRAYKITEEGKQSISEIIKQQNVLMDAIAGILRG